MHRHSSCSLLSFALKLCQTSDTTRGFRTAVLRILARKYQSLAEPDYINVCQCLQYLNDAQVGGWVLVAVSGGGGCGGSDGGSGGAGVSPATPAAALLPLGSALV
jgi:hypothetical protein